MEKILVPIIIAIVGSNALFGFMQFLINRKDKNNSILTDILNKINFIDQGLVRMQLLVLISNYPNRTEEIMKLAEQYFCKFKGNFYLTTLFKQYLDEHNLVYPQWFMDYKDKN